MKGFWNSKTDDEVLKAINVESLTFIGKFKKYNKISLFENIRNTDYSPVLNLKSNLDDRNFVKVQILNKSNFELKPNAYYKITAFVIPQKTRNFHESEFLFQFTNESSYESYEPVEKEFTEQIFKKYSEANTANSQDILKSVKTITYQINKRNETFIYELLQNADDYPIPRSKVTVNFYVTDKYLLFTHSGAIFNFNNVYSLCAVNAEDKVDELDKIGFKGIGFKSVFKANEFVYIKSGCYSFRFDKAFHHAEYPWQVMPIWTEIDDLEISLRNNHRFLNSNVAIALRPRTPAQTLTEYAETLNLFSDERILLFLRNVEKVNVFLKNDAKIFCTKNENRWWLKQFEVEVPEAITEFLTTQINEGNEEVPVKFANLNSCKISFASLIDRHKISTLNDGKLFNYLPLSINLNFPFLINSDFIPDGEREGLINNKWNEFLLNETGKQFLHYIKETVSDSKREESFTYSIFNLIPSFSIIENSLKNNEKWNDYFNWFKSGFESALTFTEFIPTQDGSLALLSTILIDETGVSELIGVNFKELTGIDKKRIHSKVGDGIAKVKSLISDYKLGRLYTVSDLKGNEGILNEKFQEWLKIPQNNFEFLQHLYNSSNSELKALLETEEIILTESGELSNAEGIYSSIPDEVAFISNNKLNAKLKELLDKSKVVLKTTKFNAIDFLISNKDKVNPLLTTENNIINFWNFIYDNWKEFKENDEVKKSLRLFRTLCKPIKTDELNIKPVSETYLCREMAAVDEVESIIESLKLNDKFFINPVFTTNENRKHLETWASIFAGAKSGLFAVMNELIPQLKELEDSQHFKACNQIYKYWSKNKDKAGKQFTIDQEKLLRGFLKLKTESGFQLASSCVIPIYYSVDKRINEIIPSISLPNQISNEYEPNEKLVSDWKQFFVFVGCKDLNSEQKIFNEKVDYLLNNQLAFQKTHLTTIKEIDSLFISNEAKEVKLSFDFTNKLSRIQLKTSVDEIWELPNSIHFSSDYNPELDLQTDNEESSNFKFLSTDYFANAISACFLKGLGVKSNFEFTLIANGNYSFYPDKILASKKYLPSFWNFITANDLRAKQFYSSNIFTIIKSSESILVEGNSYSTPSELYSKNLAKYIPDKKLLPEINLTTFFVDTKNTLTLEQAIGVNQELNIEHCLTLLKREDSISLKEVSDLKIVNIIQRNTITSEQLKEIKLPNSQSVWLTKELLFTSNDPEITNKYPDFLLHTDFTSVASKFQVKSISKSDFEFHHTKDNSVNADGEIKKAFTDRAEYLAFALKDGASDFSSTATQIVNTISAFTFIKCNDISKSISYGNLSWGNEFTFFPDDNVIYFVDEINSKKSQLRKWLFEQVKRFGNVKQTTFERIIFDGTEKSIIDDFKDYEIPLSWKDRISGNYKLEVEEFINELENSEWSQFIPDLKNILELNLSPEEKEKIAFNLIAKIKLGRKLKMPFTQNSDDYNQVSFGAEKYFVHSARGAFAYIHPKEIIEMKRNGFRMALDFGSKFEIKIYSSAEEILNLNRSHLLLYQNQDSIDNLFSFCEANSSEKKHLLIIDRTITSEKRSDIYKLLNPEL